MGILLAAILAIFFLNTALTTSMEINTTMPKPKMSRRSDIEGLIIPKASRMDGIWMSNAVNMTCEIIEMTSHICGGDLNTLYRIERKLRAMISSMMIKRNNCSVLAWVISESWL